MSRFSDELHMDTCSHRFCNEMLKRSEMFKNPSGRGWLCPYHFQKLPKTPGQKG